MKNDFEIRCSITAIFIKRKDGTILETIIDTADLKRVQEYPNSWRVRWDEQVGSFYVYGRIYKERKEVFIPLHRWILNAPPGKVVDHINHNTLDNRRSNLRIVTQSENMLNRKGAMKNSKSGIRGVYWDKRRKRWRALLRIKGKTVYSRTFSNLDDAKTAIDKKIKEILQANQ